MDIAPGVIAGVRPVDLPPEPGVAGVPGIGSRKCSLNHFINWPNVSKVCFLNRKPSGVTVTNSCRTLSLGMYVIMNLPESSLLAEKK